MATYDLDCMGEAYVYTYCYAQAPLARPHGLANIWCKVSGSSIVPYLNNQWDSVGEFLKMYIYKVPFCFAWGPQTSLKLPS